MSSLNQARGTSPRYTVPVALALALAGGLVIVAASSECAFAHRVSVSAPRISAPSSLNVAGPRFGGPGSAASNSGFVTNWKQGSNGIGGPDTKSLGGPDTKSLGGPDTKSLGGPDTKGAAKGFRGGVKTGMSAKGIIIIGGKQKAASNGCDAQTVFCQNNLVPAVQNSSKAGPAPHLKTAKGPINPGTIKGFNPQPDPPGAIGNPDTTGANVQ